MKELSITTSGLYNLSVGKIRKISIPIPPLNEQKRIVANVDQLMALCDDLESKLQKSQKRNDRLMEAAVAEMLAA
jgi:type I restriction enzyme S subunit